MAVVEARFDSLPPPLRLYLLSLSAPTEQASARDDILQIVDLTSTYGQCLRS